MAGYIYCFSNPLMPGIYKIGMTTRTPLARLEEANASDTWRPPADYKIEFAKKVNDVKDKETTLHTLMDTYRIHPRREFFNIPIDEARTLFDLFDGQMWNQNSKTLPLGQSWRRWRRHGRRWRRQGQVKIPRAIRELRDYLKPPKK